MNPPVSSEVLAASGAARLLRALHQLPGNSATLWSLNLVLIGCSPCVPPRIKSHECVFVAIELIILRWPSLLVSAPKSFPLGNDPPAEEGLYKQEACDATPSKSKPGPLMFI